MLIRRNHTDYYAYTASHVHRKESDAIVFVHGAAMDHSVWAHQSRYFAYHGWNVAAVDLPGHNRSGGGLAGGIEELAAWLMDVAGQIPGRGLHLVGHSMGALIVLETAAGLARARQAAGGTDDTDKAGNKAGNTDNASHAPVRSLTLIGFSYPMQVTLQLLQAAEHDPSAAYGMMTRWSHASPIGGEPVPGFWSPGMQLSMMENSAPGAVLADLRACNGYAGGEAAFADVGCPTLFLCGQRDRMAPAKLAGVHAARNDNAEIVFLPRCGHSLLSEAPDGVLHELKRFFGAHRTP